MKTETPRQLAEKIVIDAIENSATCQTTSRINFDVLVEAVTTVLNAERERAARILEDRVLALKQVKNPTTHNTWSQLDLVDLAAKIRGKD